MKNLIALLSLLVLVSPAFAQHRMLIADESKKRIAIVDKDGKIEWEHKIGSLHDLHMLANGNVLMHQGITKIVEVIPKNNEVVWQYDSAKMNGNEGKKVEVHAFQRLADGVTMIAESGTARIIEVDKDGKLLKEVKLKVNKPHPHMDTRLARKIANGNYLVTHEGDAAIREYDGDGKVVWEYEVPMFDKKPAGGHGPEAWGNKAFSAIRLKNGNTLIGAGNGHSVLEVTPAKEIVWKVEQKELPGITLAWVTTVEVLSNGNIVIGNCHGGPDNPQIVEITREKKVVWTFKDMEKFGNSTTNSQVLDAGETNR